MVSAGARARQSTALSVDDSASVLTLHSIDDRKTAPPPRRSPRRTKNSSAVPSSATSLIIQRPDPLPSTTSSAQPSSAPSLIIQQQDDPSRPSTGLGKKMGSRRKIEQLVPDYNPDVDLPPATAARDNFLKPKVPIIPVASAAHAPAATFVRDTIATRTDNRDEESLVPPKFTIDLSKPPGERYDHVAPHFAAQKKTLQRLFDDLVRDMTGKRTDFGRRWGQRLLKKIPSKEEQEEIEGIAKAWDVDIYLLVAFNVLLDSFMGCTSGGVRVKDPPPGKTPETRTSPKRTGRSKSVGRKRDNPKHAKAGEAMEEQPDSSLAPPPLGGSTDLRGRMLHFRTLDWAMDPLRKIVCQFEYINFPGGDVVARSITYFGFVGILTGVRKGLSISLNFRPMHDTSSAWKRAAFRWHQCCVFLGWRQGIASTLRECLLPSKYNAIRLLPSLVDLERDLPKAKSTAAYLIFSDGSRTTTVEKDHKSAVIRSASDFIVALNHDVADEAGALRDGQGHTVDPLQSYRPGGNSAFSSPSHSRQPSPSPGPSMRRHLTPTASIGRSNHGASDLESLSDGRRQEADQAKLQQLGLGSLIDDSKHRKGCIAKHWKTTKEKRGGPAVRTEDLLTWMKDPALCSDETHYACIMDPTVGEIIWVRRWTIPLRPDDPR